MPVIKGKKAKSKKAKKPKVVPDPDEKFKQTLDTEMYVPKRTRERNDDELSQRVNSVFNLYTSEETQSDPNVVPMIKIAPIVRSLGLCPTNDQLKLISTMAAKGDNGAAYVERKVLEAVLLDILRTRILNYNPQVLSAPHPNFPERFSSVVYTAEEKHIAATFDSLWKTCGSCVTTSEGGDLRYIDAKELQKVALDSPELITGENEFTQQEIEDFLLTFTSSDSNVIREDTFLLLMLDVNHDNNSISRKDYTMDQLAELLKSMTDEEAKKVLSQLPTLLKATTQESQNADAKTADESAHDASADSTRVEQILSIDEDAPLTEALGVPETSTRAQEKKLKREQQQKEKELKKQQEQKEKELKKEQERRERELKKEQEQRERELKKEQEHREKEEARLKKLEEKEQQKKELEEKRAAEREARLSEKLERENARLSAKLEKENQRLEAQKAANASKAQPTASLSAFGFVSNTIKLDDNSDKLFSQFVQDKRIVPEALRFWEDGTTKEGAESENCAKSCLSEASNALFSIMSDGHLDNEESSLLHPLCKDVSIIEKQKFSSFNAMIEASNTQPAKTSNLCSCGFHANSKPFDLFNDELIYINFSAIGYEPCQSRPPYFGTFNTIQNGGLSNVELFQMARFSLDQEMPRLCNVDYEYDSGDDWDVADGDDISSTSTDDSDGANSLESTELDFINDDDGSDSEDGWQRKTMEARQRRMNRLKGKEKLIPAFSGPFVGIPCSDHPLRSYDRLQRVTPLTGVFFTALLEAEIRAHNNFSSSGATAEDIALGDEQQKLVAAALNNRQREMSESELSALDLIVKANAKISMKGILDALNQQQLCVGVAKSEVFRTVRRFYERRHGMYIKRDKPWEPTDERLFQKRKTARSANDPQDGDDGDDCEEPTPSGTNAGGVQRLEDLPAFNMPVSNTIE